MILTALDKAGGAKYLQRQAEANPVAFMTLISRVLPTTLAADPNAPQTLGFIVIPPKQIAAPTTPVIDAEPDADSSEA
jgi:hypothetical protein